MNIDDPEVGQNLYYEGKAALDAGDVETAIEKLTASSDSSPHFKTYEYLAECFLQRKNYRKAIFYSAAAAGLGIKQSRSRFLLAQALLGDGQKDKAIEKLNEALEINAEYKAARLLLKELIQEK